jgi:long-chain fatty acid transport protein
MKRAALFALIMCTVLSLPAWAGGLWLNEFGDPAGGRASAGAVAGVDDASAVLHNAASISRHEGSQVMLTVGYIEPDTQFDVESSSPGLGTNDGGDAGLGTPVFSTFYVRDLQSEKWTAGLSVAALSGAGLEYDNDWVGRYQVTEVTIVLLALAPTIAYQVNEKFSIGASLQLWYTSLEMDVAIPNPLPPAGRPDGLAEIDGDDYDVGFTIGLMYEFSPRTRIGFNYQSEIETSFDSDVDISPQGLAIVADLDIPLAQTVRLGLHHDINEKWGLDFTAGWDDWSTLDHILITGTGGAGVIGTLDQGWEDTYHLAAGFQYHHTPALTFTAGIAYDDSPQRSSRRTPDLPVDEQLRIAVGFTREMRDNFSVGAYLNYIDLGDARIENADWVGEYSSNSLIQFSLNFNWKLNNK